MGRYRPKFGDPISPWHKAFAWLPVCTVDHGWKWLCHVHRRRIQTHDYLSLGPKGWYWQYAKEYSFESTGKRVVFIKELEDAITLYEEKADIRTYNCDVLLDAAKSYLEILKGIMGNER